MQSLVVHNVSYAHADGAELFSGLSLTLAPIRYGLVGRNGSGKTTLARLISGELTPSSGSISVRGRIGYLEQIEAADGSTTIEQFVGGPSHEVVILLARLGAQGLSLARTLETLSGGERLRVRLARALAHNPEWLILDEPTNHLDAAGREILYRALREHRRGAIVISHDRELLSHVDAVIELRGQTTHLYGGNYEFYQVSRDNEDAAIERSAATARAKLKQERRDAIEHAQRSARRASAGRAHTEAENLPKVIRGGLERKAQKTAAKAKAVHEQRIKRASRELAKLRDGLGIVVPLAFDTPAAAVPRGRVVYARTDEALAIVGPERIAITGANGSGKTTLLRQVAAGARVPAAFLDQHLEFLPANLTLAEAMREVAPLETEHARRVHLGRAGFTQERTTASIGSLSGGERMRAALGLLFASDRPPQLLLLDEPESHLDLESLEQLELALGCYQGALMVVSHDETFLAHVNVERRIDL